MKPTTQMASRGSLQRLATISVLAALTLAMSPVTASADVGWSIVSSPNNGTEDALYGVSCPSSTSCQAVGYYQNTVNTAQTLIESWNGIAWDILSSPNDGTDSNWLRGVSCASTTSCQAVGYYQDEANGSLQTLIESWSGDWTIASSPNEGSGDALYAVSCPSTTSCQAVGSYTNANGNFQTLIESWNGTEWSIVSSPNDGTGGVLYGVSCSSAVSCQAVGNYSTASGLLEPLLESWNGNQWSIASEGKRTETSNSVLWGVSCSSGTSCKAVGYGDDTGPRALIESWNGTKWSTGRSENVLENALYGVSCPSRTSCTAVGYDGSIESSRGTKWTLSSSLGDEDVLQGVSCASATSCSAVGSYWNSSGVTQTLIESY